MSIQSLVAGFTEVTTASVAVDKLAGAATWTSHQRQESRGACGDGAGRPYHRIRAAAARVNVLTVAATKTANEPAVREALDKLNLGYSFADAATFQGRHGQRQRIF